MGRCPEHQIIQRKLAYCVENLAEGPAERQVQKDFEVSEFFEISKNSCKNRRKNVDLVSN